jgi:hypothetical protein
MILYGKNLKSDQPDYVPRTDLIQRLGNDIWTTFYLSLISLTVLGGIGFASNTVLIKCHRLHMLSPFNLPSFAIQPCFRRRLPFRPSLFTLQILVKILPALARLAISLVSCALDRFSSGASPAISSSASADSWMTNMGEKSASGHSSHSKR